MSSAWSTAAIVLCSCVFTVAATVPELLWKVPTTEIIYVSPAVANGMVYIASEDASPPFASHGVRAFDAATGKVVWKVSIDVVYSTPVVKDGVVFIATEGGLDHIHGYMYALNASTGSQLWKTAIGTFSSNTAAVEDGVVFAAAGNGYVYALDASSGKIIWKAQPPLGPALMAFVTSPTVVNGVLYIGNHAAVCAFRTQDGKLLWLTGLGDDGGTIGGTVSVSGNKLFIGKSRRLYALSVNNGTIIWHTKLNFSGLLSPVASGELVYFNTDGFTYAVTSDTGSYVWNVSTSHIVSMAPSVAAGVLYTMSGGTCVLAINALNGHMMWNYSLGYYPDASGVSSSPVVVGSVLYTGAWGPQPTVAGGYVLALKI
jgi:outer membrane protein assembly factor BamB